MCACVFLRVFLEGALFVIEKEDQKQATTFGVPYVVRDPYSVSPPKSLPDLSNPADLEVCTERFTTCLNPFLVTMRPTHVS